MRYIKKEHEAVLEVKKSKFITHICPYNDFETVMNRLKKEHPKARHFVYAYRYLNQFDQIVQNSSDDGEPKGTSGKPSLNVLNGSNIINSAVIIVRYFGGIKLGTGGLVKAYSDAVNLVLSQAESIEYVKVKKAFIEIDYPMLSQIEYIILQNGIDIKNKSFNINVKIQLESSKEKFENLQKILPRECIFEYE